MGRLFELSVKLFMKKQMDWALGIANIFANAQKLANSFLFVKM